MRRAFGLTLAAALAAGCAEAPAEGPVASIDAGGFEFFDAFERSASELARRDGGPWGYVKLTHNDNRVEIVDAVRDGAPTRAYRSYAVNDTDPVSKATITIDGLNAQPGEIVEVAFCMNAAPGVALNDVFITDLECNTCWSPLNVKRDQSPGVRVQLKEQAGYPAIERAKIMHGRDSFRALHSDANAMPRRWTPIVWRVGLGYNDEGWSELFVDGALSSAGRGGTLPDAALFEADGVRLDRSRYDYVELGVTANASDAPLSLLFDNVRVRTGDKVVGVLDNPCEWDAS